MSTRSGGGDRGDSAAATTPSRPPLEADDTPIGRDWVEWAKHLETENERLRDAVEKAWAFCGTTSYFEQRKFARPAFEEMALALIALRPEPFTKEATK